ncbi:MAG: DUF4314 domain-containing protein [Acutalibacter sp.]|nr:DUF4314 domain-containing protein [Acutalibacter sp.]
MNFDRNKVEMVKRQYPVGTRIRLNSLCNDGRGMPAGLCGTVIGVDDQPSLLMKWDNGRTLSLFPGEDNFTVIMQEHEEIDEKSVNARLYDKLDQEQAKYMRTFLLQPPQEMLDNAWEYAIRLDILEALEDHELDCEQAEALLKLPDTMDVLARAVLDQNNMHVYMIIGAIEDKADELVDEQSAHQPGRF